MNKVSIEILRSYFLPRKCSLGSCKCGYCKFMLRLFRQVPASNLKEGKLYINDVYEISFFYILVIFMMIILNFHLTHISRFSNVSCMSEELVKALSSGGAPDQPHYSIEHFD